MRILKTCIAICLLFAVCCFTACTLPDLKSCNDETPTTTKKVVSEKHYVTFIADGEQVAKIEYKDKDSTIVVPAVPDKEGFVGVWEDYTLNGKNITVNAVYSEIVTENKTFVTFMADETQVAKIEYENGALSEDAPAVPEKLGYTGAWEEYTLDGEDKTVNAVYTAIEYKISYMFKSPIDASEKEMNTTVFEGLKTTYTIEDSIISIPLENNDMFSVWWLNDEHESTKTNEPIVLKGRTGDLVVHCRWR